MSDRIIIDAADAADDPVIRARALHLCRLAALDPETVWRLEVDEHGVTYLGPDFDTWDRRSDVPDKVLAHLSAREIAALRHPSSGL